MMWLFRDRHEAGQKLAENLTLYANRDDVTVLALPRGGVPVAFEVAKALKAPLDVLVVRKLGVPGHEELALGAIASGGVRVLNEGIIEGLGLSEALIGAVAEKEQRELARREQSYRGDRPPLSVAGWTVILVDDGVATGATIRAALAALKELGPVRLVVAVPTAAGSSCAALKRYADEVVCLETPEPYIAVGVWYRNFSQTSDGEVRRLLRELAAAPRSDERDVG